MKNMEKKLTVLKWGMINRPNIPKCPKMSAQIICPSPKACDFDDHRLHWVSVVCGQIYQIDCFLNFDSDLTYIIFLKTIWVAWKYQIRFDKGLGPIVTWEWDDSNKCQRIPVKRGSWHHCKNFLWLLATEDKTSHWIANTWTESKR